MGIAGVLRRAARAMQRPVIGDAVTHGDALMRAAEPAERFESLHPRSAEGRLRHRRERRIEAPICAVVRSPPGDHLETFLIDPVRDFLCI